MRSSYAIFALLCLFLLTGCDVNVSQAQSVAICHALIGPIHYNTFNPKSGRYSGHILAIDLKMRNQVGQALHCAQYR
jgi:hypothetical protein